MPDEVIEFSKNALRTFLGKINNDLVCSLHKIVNGSINI